MRKLLIIAWFLVAIPTFATTRYIAQTAGTFSGGSACNGQTAIAPATWYSTSLSPDDINWICGSIVGAVNTNVLSLPNSNGTSGHPIVLNFDTGASVTAPYGTPLYLHGQSHWQINGGVNGYIANTDNGTNLTYQKQVLGIYDDAGGVDLEIENLTIGPMYLIVGADSANEAAWAQSGCLYQPEGYDALKIHNNTATYCGGNGFEFSYAVSTSSGSFYNNTMDYCAHCLIVGDATGGSTATGILIYGNKIGPHFQAFQGGGSYVHADGIFLFATNSGSFVTGNIYNNYVHGDMCSTGGNCTAYLFIGSGVINTNVFNNTFWSDAGQPEADIVVSGGIQSPNNLLIANNTLGGPTNGIRSDQGGSLSYTAGTNITLENNIFATTNIAILSGPANFNQFVAINYNDYYGFTTVAANQATLGPGNYFNTLANFQATTIAGSVHPEASGSNGNPLIYTGAPPYYITTGSAAATGGVNLTSLSIATLDADAPYTFGTGYACGGGCAARPSTGSNNWPRGAYQVPGSPPPVIPPAPAPQMFVWSGTVKAPVTVTLSGSTVVSPIAFAGTESRKISCTCIVPVTGKMGCACQ